MNHGDALPEIPSSEGVMIAAFEGWNDAGSAASAALDHMARIWNTREYAALDPENYHDFQVSRPTISRNDRGERVISWPGTVVSHVPSEYTGGRSVSVVRGIEPSMRWREYCREILDLAEDLDVDTLVTCGALLVDTPHTRPLPIFVTSEDAKARTRYDVERSDYDGPIGITGVLAHEAHLRGLTVLSMWVGVPHYVAHPPSPGATLTLLGALENLLGSPIDVGDLPYEAEAWQRGADDVAADDDDIAAHVRTLEETTDTANLQAASGEAIAAEVEQFLKKNDPHV